MLIFIEKEAQLCLSTYLFIHYDNEFKYPNYNINFRIINKQCIKFTSEKENRKTSLYLNS